MYGRSTVSVGYDCGGMKESEGEMTNGVDCVTWSTLTYTDSIRPPHPLTHLQYNITLGYT